MRSGLTMLEFLSSRAPRDSVLSEESALKSMFCSASAIYRNFGNEMRIPIEYANRLS